MVIIDVGQKVPAVLLGPYDQPFLGGIVIAVGDSGAHLLLPKLEGISISLLKQCTLMAGIPVKGLGIGGSHRADKQRTHFGQHGFEQSMVMVVHQRQCQNTDAITPGHDGENGIEHQPVLAGIEDNAILFRALENMFERFPVVLSSVTSHNLPFLRSQLYVIKNGNKTIG